MGVQIPHVDQRLVHVVSPSTSINIVRYGTVRYIGEVDGTMGLWLGVEWDQADQGKHDGVHRGRRYFKVLCPGTPCASFIRPPIQSMSGSLNIGGRDFLGALRHRYVGEEDVQLLQIGGSGTYSRRNLAEIQIEAPNLAKVQRRLGQLSNLKVVALTGPAASTNPDLPRKSVEQPEQSRQELADQVRSIPGQMTTEDEDVDVVSRWVDVQYLDLSRTLFSSFLEVAILTRHLTSLRTLLLHHNRFSDLQSQSSISLSEPCAAGSHIVSAVLDEALAISSGLRALKELGLDGTRIGWQDLLAVGNHFPSLEKLQFADNGLQRLVLAANTTGQSLSADLGSLEEINLESNDLDSWQDICAALSPLQSLRTLHLSGNHLSRIEPLQEIEGGIVEQPKFPLLSLSHISLSENPVFRLSGPTCDSSPEGLVSPLQEKMSLIWSSIYSLDASMTRPGLRSLSVRLGVSTKDQQLPPNNHHGRFLESQRAEWSPNLIARLPALKRLNGSDITSVQRKDAELWWLGQMQLKLDKIPAESQRVEMERREPALERLRAKYGDYLMGERRSRDSKDSSVSGNNRFTLQSRLLHLQLRLASSPPSCLQNDPDTGDIKAVLDFPVLPCAALKALRLKISQALGLQRNARVRYFAVLKEQEQRQDQEARDVTMPEPAGAECVSFEINDELRELGQWGFHNGDELWVVRKTAALN